MITNFIHMNGYGLYVWSSFGIVIFACSILYYKTRKTLKKYENEFLVELQKLSSKKQLTISQKSKIANYILASQNKVV
jgi:heme exporter protein CcmD